MASIKQIPAKLDLFLVPGDDFVFTIHSSIDLSGYKLTAKAGSIIFTIAEPAGSEEPGHYYNIALTAEQTAGIVRNRAWYLEWDDTNSLHRRVISGSIVIPK